MILHQIIDFKETPHYENLRDFIMLSKQHRDDMFKMIKPKGVELHYFFKDYCIVNYKGPRRMGHTTNSLILAAKHFNKTLMVCLNNNMARNISQVMVGLEHINPRVMDINIGVRANIHNFNVYNYDFIIVDVFSVGSKRENLMKFLTENCNINTMVLCL